MLETIVVFQKFAALKKFTFLVIVWANNSMENRRNLAKQKIVHSLIFYISVFSLRNDWWLPRNWKSMIHSAIEVHESSKVDLKKLVVKMSLLMTSVENKPFCAKLSHSLIASTSIPWRNLYWMDGIWTYDALTRNATQKRDHERACWWGATIAQWIRLHLLSCRPRFESQAHHLCFHQFIELRCMEKTDFFKSM